jgi:oligosaccharyltransferase complex subunit alpha (ribophorin I)
MKPFSIAAALLGLVSGAAAATTGTSKIDLPTEFKPPPTFKNANLVHIISLEKNYVKEQVNVLIESVASEPQDEYYIPFTADQMSRLGGLEVKDRKNANSESFVVDAVELDPFR